MNKYISFMIMSFIFVMMFQNVNGTEAIETEAHGYNWENGNALFGANQFTGVIINVSNTIQIVSVNISNTHDVSAAGATQLKITEQGGSVINITNFSTGYEDKYPNQTLIYINASLTAGKKYLIEIGNNNSNWRTPTLNNSVSLPKNTGVITWTNGSFIIERDWAYFTSIDSITYNLSIGMDNCTVHSTEIFNITLYDEVDKFYINEANNTILKLNLNLSFGDIRNSIIEQYENLNPLRICASDSLNNQTRIDLILQYSADDYVTEYYNVKNGTLQTYQGDIKLYGLDTTSSTEYLINLKDDTFIVYPDAIIEMERIYVDTDDEIIEAPITDSLGRTIGHFVSNDVLYNLYIKENNQIIAVFNNVRVYCTTGNDCVLNLNIPSAALQIDDFDTINNVKYTTTYNSGTGVYSFYYLSDDVTTKTINLTGVRFDNYGNETLCSEQEDGINGVISCTFYADDTNQSAIIYGYVNGDLIFTDYLVLDYENIEDFTAIKYLLAALLLPMMVLMGAFSGSIAIIMFILGLGLVVGINLIDTQGTLGAASFIIWLVVAAAILLWKISKGGVKNG